MDIISPSNKTLAELQADYVKTREEQTRIAEERKRIARESVLPDIAALFVAIPDLRRISVDGTTPYFNDGDACVHGQGEPKYDRTGYCYEDDDSDTMPELPREAFDQIASVIAAMEEPLNVAFDTHWTLTFTRSGDGMAYVREDNTDHD